METSLRLAPHLKLGLWVSGQRALYAKKLSGDDSTLTDAKISRLNALEFIWDVKEFQWEQMFTELKRYVKEHGNADISRGYVTSDKIKLGWWVWYQRAHAKQLSDLKKERLNALGFVWKVKG